MFKDFLIDYVDNFWDNSDMNHTEELDMKTFSFRWICAFLGLHSLLTVHFKINSNDRFKKSIQKATKKITYISLLILTKIKIYLKFLYFLFSFRWVCAFLGLLSFILFLPFIFKEVDVSLKERQYATECSKLMNEGKTFYLS